MSETLISMLQGKVQCRHMRHQVAEWAHELAPEAARPLLLQGEAMLDQPPSGHDETESEPVLRAALQRPGVRVVSQRFEAAGLTASRSIDGGDASPDGSYFSDGGPAYLYEHAAVAAAVPLAVPAMA